MMKNSSCLSFLFRSKMLVFISLLLAIIWPLFHLSSTQIFLLRYPSQRPPTSNRFTDKFPFFLRRLQRETADGSQIKNIATLINNDPYSFNRTLSKIMVPRVCDTSSHANVQKFIDDYLKSLDWVVEHDQFEDETPLGKLKFTNIIGTLNPHACKRVVLACHYDSKYFSDFEFLGATDSAVPCAMILEIIYKLDTLLKRHKALSNDDFTLQVIFFDGEEAFRQWSSKDSIYGARHLASRLHSLTSRATTCGPDTITEMDRLKVLILLDLIGEASPRFCSFFRSTQKMFNHLMQIERKLNKLQVMETKRKSGTNYFARCPNLNVIEDDHIPFQQLGVPILHLITTPFPLNWHLQGDDGTNLHYPTINNLLKILTVFIFEEFKLYRFL